MTRDARHSERNDRPSSGDRERQEGAEAGRPYRAAAAGECAAR